MMLGALGLSLTNFVTTAEFYSHFLNQKVRPEILGFNVENGIQILNVDEESNISTWWFSSSVLLLCSVLLASITSVIKRSGDHYALHRSVLSITLVLLLWAR